MLSYRHGFHAGNFADVHKHIVLLMVMDHLLTKDKPFCCIDTHGGAGHYDLESRYAVKNREFEFGIGRLWERSDCPPAVARYLSLVQSFNPARADGTRPLRYYPGSPRIMRGCLRPRDRLLVSELHSTEVPALKQCFARDIQVSVHFRDGFEFLPGIVPPRERRGIAFLDPAYELRDEMTRATESLVAAWEKWSTGIYCLWYPLQRRQPVAQFHRALKRSGLRKVLCSELSVAPELAPNRLTGSGLIIVNPPWHMAGELQAASAWLENVLMQGEHLPARTEWLVPE